MYHFAAVGKPNSNSTFKMDITWQLSSETACTERKTNNRSHPCKQVVLKKQIKG